MLMTNEIRAFMLVEELDCAKRNNITRASFFLNEEALIQYIGHLYRNKTKEVIILRIDSRDKKFCLKDLAEKYLINSSIIKTISFKEWLWLKTQQKTLVNFQDKTNPKKNNPDVVTIQILEKRTKEN